MTPTKQPSHPIKMQLGSFQDCNAVIKLDYVEASFRIAKVDRWNVGILGLRTEPSSGY